MIDIRIRKVDKDYTKVTVIINGTSVDLGFLNREEVQDLGSNLAEVAEGLINASTGN